MKMSYFRLSLFEEFTVLYHKNNYFTYRFSSNRFKLDAEIKDSQ